PFAFPPERGSLADALEQDELPNRGLMAQLESTEVETGGCRLAIAGKAVPNEPLGPRRGLHGKRRDQAAANVPDLNRGLYARLEIGGREEEIEGQAPGRRVGEGRSEGEEALDSVIHCYRRAYAALHAELARAPDGGSARCRLGINHGVGPEKAS